MKMIVAILILGYGQQTLAQNDFLKEYLIKWQNGAQYTIDLAKSMPEHKFDFKPNDDVRNFREQLEHIVNNMIWLSESYLTQEKFGVDLKRKNLSKAEMLQLLSDATEFANNAVENLDPKELDVVVEFFAGPMTKRQILMLMSDHMTHHRGQIIIYVRMNGIKPPRYRGW